MKMNSNSSENARWLRYLKGEIESCCACGRFEAATSYKNELRQFATKLIAGRPVSGTQETQAKPENPLAAALAGQSSSNQRTSDSSESLNHLMKTLHSVGQALRTLSCVAWMADVSVTPYDGDVEKASIWHNAQKNAYNHVLEMCSAQSIEDFLNEKFTEHQNEASVLAKLQEVVRGLAIIESALNLSSNGDLSQANFPLTGEYARIQLEAQKQAYSDALAYRAFATLRSLAFDNSEQDAECEAGCNTRDRSAMLAG